MPRHLRVFSETGESLPTEPAEPTIRVTLANLLPLLAIAKRHNYLWLQDFLDDEILIHPDLYEVLRAFEAAVKRPSA